jgi:zinc D-Ala-D-Ala carboxypeptidase
MAANPPADGARTVYADRVTQIARVLGIPAGYAAACHLELQFEATALESVGLNAEGNEIRLAPAAAAAWRKMAAAARAGGITLLPISGFRSVDRQVELFRAKQAAGEPAPEILRLLAAPGFSEHHTGRAVDVGAPDEPPLIEGFAQTSAFRWLTEHGADFGFRLSFPPGNPHQIAYEPWHWCYIGET